LVKSKDKTKKALIIKIMQAGTFETMKTVNLYTGADVAAAAVMANNASYTPPAG